MKKNLYFQTVYQSTRALEAQAATAMLRILSFPRTLLEVFIRRNMGERYFGYGQVGFLVLGIGYLGYILAPRLYMMEAQKDLQKRLESNGYMYNRNWADEVTYTDSLEHFCNVHFASWYFFLLAFIIVSYLRHSEIKRLPSVFDFGRCSLYTGDINSFFINFKWKNKHFDIRQIETILEPLACSLFGLVLVILQQYIGYVIIIASVGYWLNARIIYYQGDHFIMDRIDETFYNQGLDEAFVNDDDINSASGVRYYGRKPANPDDRREVANLIIEAGFVEIR